MQRRRLGLSIALGTILTVGLFLGFELVGESATASTNATGVADTEINTDTISKAEVVVIFSGEKAAVRSISWTGTISRVAALKAAGFSVQTSEGAICNIDGDGCPPSDCFCPENFWWQGIWDQDAQDWIAPWPLPDPSDGDVLGFRNSKAAWGQPVLPAAAYTRSLQALSWLKEQQQTDGGFGTINATAEVLMAVSANEMDASQWGDRPSLIAQTLSSGVDLAGRNAAGAGMLATALAPQESCWPIGARHPMSYYDSGSFNPSGDTLYQAWGMLGTTALSETVPMSALQSLKNNQVSNGGWEWAVGQGADTNSTALALQALVASGEPLTSTSIVRGLAYLESAQNEDGGFPYNPHSSWGRGSDTNSTAYVVQALFAVGEDVLAGNWALTETNPISYLLSMQLPDGSFEWQEGSGSNAYATRQAIPALLHRPFPLAIEDIDSCYAMKGQVLSSVGESENPLEGVKMEAEGAGDLFFGETGASGTYTISVPTASTFSLTPHRDGFVFTPTLRTVLVSGSAGDIIPVGSFAGETRVYLPLVIRH